MNPYLAATLAGVVIATVIGGIQCLCIWLGSVSRRRARRAEWERERPYREANRALDDAQFAYRHLESIKRLHRQGLLRDDQAAQMIASVQAEIDITAAQLHQAYEALDGHGRRP